jgi:multidrug efflux pump subunit AcrB
VFLQSRRATLIRSWRAVAIIGTFAGMLALGFSINTLTLFGLVLPSASWSTTPSSSSRTSSASWTPGLPREATVRAMEQVTGPVIAIVLVLGRVRAGGLPEG